MTEPRRIEILSDSTGETAEKVVRAAMLQFPHSGAHIRLHTRVRTKDAARPILELAAKEGALVVFTVVSPELREFIHAQSYELKVESLDLIGSLIGKLSTFLDRQPINMPSGMLPLTEEYFRRIEAVEFAVKSDDGKEPRNFKKADIVLVGVSRTSKTPLSIYLGYLGWKATNVPLVKGIEPPAQLFEIDPARIVGLTIEGRRLSEIRSQRLVLMGGDRSYADLNEVYEDLEHAAAIHKRLGCPIIDVSELSIEEIALRIIRVVERRLADGA
jgi:regulator of PEP synthase PpsR (kinase-PPPase family)